MKRKDSQLFIATIFFTFSFMAFIEFSSLIAKILELIACIGSFILIVYLARHNLECDKINNSKVTQNIPKPLYTFKNGDDEMLFNGSDGLHNHK